MSCDNCEVKFSDFASETLFNWCTNCGNYGIYASVKHALVKRQTKPKDVVLCFDVGCNGNGSDKIGGYRIHGLHGRVLALAAGVSIANDDLTVIAHGGDGGTLSEGINHFIHSIRNNYNFTFVLHNNHNYGLTTGQASATTPKGTKMNAAPDGVVLDPINVSQLALGLGATFYARGFSADVAQLTDILDKAIEHKGFSLVEVMQDCPTYNKATPHEWYMERVFNVSTIENYDEKNLVWAKEVSLDLENKIATGVIYQDASRQDFLTLQKNRTPISTLVDEVRNYDVQGLLKGLS